MLPEARRVKRISYDEMLELASLGAGVMHSRSIEFAKKFTVPIHVRSCFSDARGTMIVAEPEVARSGGVRRGADEGRSAGDDRRGARPAGRQPRGFLENRRPQDHGRHDRAKHRGRGKGRHFVHRQSRRIAGRRSKRSPKPPRSWAPRATATTIRWRSSRWSAWAWPGKSAWPKRCSARWPTPA